MVTVNIGSTTPHISPRNMAIGEMYICLSGEYLNRPSIRSAFGLHIWNNFGNLCSSPENSSNFQELKFRSLLAGESVTFSA